MDLSHFPLSVVVFVLTPSAPSFQGHTFSGCQGSQQIARAGSGDAGYPGGAFLPPQLTMDWLSSGLAEEPWIKSNCTKVLQLAVNWGCRQHQQQAFRQGQCAITDFQVGGVNSLGTRSVMKPDMMPARLRMWGLAVRCVWHSFQGSVSWHPLVLDLWSCAREQRGGKA